MWVSSSQRFPIQVIAVAIGATIAAHQLSALYISRLCPGCEFSRRRPRFESVPPSWQAFYFPCTRPSATARPETKPRARPRPLAITIPLVVFQLMPTPFSLLFRSRENGDRQSSILVSCFSLNCSNFVFQSFRLVDCLKNFVKNL